MREYDPCIGCEYYNKPYWSVVSLCSSCPRVYNTGGYVTTTTTNIKDVSKDIDDFMSDEPNLCKDNSMWCDDDCKKCAQRIYKAYRRERDRSV